MTNGLTSISLTMYVNFPYLCSIFHFYLHTEYGVYISQLIRYARACSPYDQLLIRGSLLTDKLKPQRFLQSRLQAAFHKYGVRYNDLVCQYNIPLGQMLSDVFHINR
jgi:hypothetical protein